MRYAGGKAMIAPALTRVIKEHMRTPARVTEIYEPFCGGANMTLQLAGTFKHVHANDFDTSVIALFKEVLAGWCPPEKVSKEDWYKLLSEHKDHDHWLGFLRKGCSFGGKGTSYGDEKSAGESARWLKKLVPLRDRITFYCSHYFFFFKQIPDGAVVYCDPPYRGTEQPYGLTFDHSMFDNAVRDLAKRALVFVSEYELPYGKLIFEHTGQSKIGQLQKGLPGYKQERTERLYLISA